MRIGVFGGTFDPPHVGHLILAMETKAQLNLDRLLWVLTPDPPHKRSREISPAAQRLLLLQAVISADQDFELSRAELDRPGPHYAIDTVRIVKKQYPDAEIFYLIGGDSLHDLPVWFKPRELIDSITGLGVMRRPGSTIHLKLLEGELPGISEKVHFVEAPLLEISAHDIRSRIAEGRPYRYYLSPEVYQLIKTNGWYHSLD